MPDRAAFSGPIGEICGLEGLARPLADKGRRPYVIHSAPGHPPIGGLGYVLAAEEMMAQARALGIGFDAVVCASGSGLTGCVATFKKRQKSAGSGRPCSVSCSHFEQLVDELNLLPNIRTAHPLHLPLPDHVHGLVSLDRSPRREEFTKALLGLHASFDRSMILLQDVVQVLDRSVAATASQDSFLLHS